MKSFNIFFFAIALLFVPTISQAQTNLHPTTGIQSTFLGACQVNTCSGIYYDNGGPSGNYSNNINNIYRTFCPDVPGRCIRLTFTSFNLEPANFLFGCYDLLQIKNGPTQNSPTVWQGCGNTLPPVITATDPSGCLTVRFNSDGSVNAAGWTANITCVPCAGPSANLNNDCINAQYVCDNLQPINANSQGPGLVSDACISGCALSENYSNWYILNVTQAGTLGMTINPTPNAADYDFALYGPNTGGCGSLGNPIRCSYAANVGPTGMRATSFDTSEDVNGDGWVSMANVVVGTYYLLVNQWAYEPNSTFRLDFSGTSVIGLPAPSISSNSPVCANIALQLSTALIPGATYSWSGPGGWSSSQQNPTRNPPVAGTYTFTYTVNGCLSSPASLNVVVNPVPTPAIIPATASVCPGQSIALEATGGVTYAWSNGGNTTIINVTPAATTTYTVTVTNANGCTATATRTATLGGSLTPVISPANPSVCLGESIVLTASGGNTFTWSTGESSASISVSPAANTTYSVTVSDGGSCTGIASTTVAVNSLPTALISPASAQICAGEDVTLSASGGTSFLWSNNITTAANTVAPLTSTTYSVTVTDANGCMATASGAVTVNTGPNASINPANATICVGESQNLTASGGVSYVWSNAAVTSGLTVAPVNTTTYSVTVTDANGCTADAAMDITVNSLPIIAANSETICNGENTTLTATGGINYLWSNAETSASIIVSPTTTSSYSVTATGANTCSATATATVTVNQLPNALIQPVSPAICWGNDITLSASGGNSYAWNTGELIPDITVSPNITTTYSMTVSDANSCTATESVSVTVNQLPVVEILPNAPSICLNESITLTAIGGISFEWSISETTNSITVAPLNPTVYSVTVTDANSCTGTSSVTVDVNALPVVDVQPDFTSICGGQNVALTATGGDTYVWSNNDSGNSISVSPFVTTVFSITATDFNGCTGTTSATVDVVQSVSVTLTSTDVSCNGLNDGTINATVSGGVQPVTFLWNDGNIQQVRIGLTAGNYSVIATDALGCAAAENVTIQEPTALAISDVVVQPTCVMNGNDGSVELDISGANAPYIISWSNGNSVSIVTGLGPGLYSVTITDANGCSLTANYPLNYQFDFSVDAGQPATITQGASTRLGYIIIGTAGTVNENWSPPGTLDCANCPSPNASPSATTLYSLVVVNEAGCAATDTVTVIVLDDVNVFAPNAFSPNGDGFNDEFQLFGDLSSIEYFEGAVFNRWGEKIFSTNVPNFRWDGTYRGKPMLPDVYVYQFRIVFEGNPKEVQRKGSVTLMR